MKPHYFIGIGIPQPIAYQLIEARKGWEIPGFKRYPLAEDLHLTLLFIGAASDEEAAALENALSSIEAAAFNLKIDGTGMFGPADKPRVVFAATEPNEALNSLQADVAAAARSAGLKMDPKPFHPHITLANKRKTDEFEGGDLPLGEYNFSADQFHLFRIQPDKEPRYVPVAAFSLNLE